MSTFLRRLLLTLIPTLSIAAAPAESEISFILAFKEEPVGVVFEIAQSREGALEWAAPRVKEYSHQLRARFPNLKLALVAHGREEFALLKNNEAKYPEIQNNIRSLVKEEDVPVHVCGTHAAWFQKYPEDFVEFIDVAPSGPAQINNYRSLGYVHVVLKP